MFKALCIWDWNAVDWNTRDEATESSLKNESEVQDD